VRLLYVIPYYRPSLAFGGPVSLCSALAEAMAGRGHKVWVLTTDAASRSDRYDTPFATIEGVAVERLRNVSQRAVENNVFTPAGTAAAVRRLSGWADVVHVHEFFTWLNHRALTISSSLGKPVLLSPHGSLSLAAERGRASAKAVWLLALGRRAIAAARLVQTATEVEAQRCVEAGVPAHKLRVLPQGVEPPPRVGDGAAFRRRWGLPESPRFLFAGRLRASKGVDLLLAAADALASHPLRPVFVLAGAEENRPDLAPGRRSPNVLLTGALTRAELADAYAAADVFVLPSFAEGLPVVALDALAYGKPVVLSHACNIPEVETHVLGELVDTELDSLRDGLASLLARQTEWPAMAERGKALVSERYAAPDAIQRYEALYEELHHD
jgi:glycosyltransferase involved in cell wall biosynthesis